VWFGSALVPFGNQNRRRHAGIAQLRNQLVETTAWLAM
jgi:hypothetical protein